MINLRAAVGEIRATRRDVLQQQTTDYPIYCAANPILLLSYEPLHLKA